MILGGGIASLFIYLISLIKSYIITRKYPVAGVYSSSFDDDPEKNKIATSTLRLKQRGFKIWGTDTSQDGRVWVLQGQIVGGGHIAGTYSAEAHHDLGVGAFYFRICGKEMKGIWTGFANKLGKTVSGQYNIKKID